MDFHKTASLIIIVMTLLAVGLVIITPQESSTRSYSTTTNNQSTTTDNQSTTTDNQSTTTDNQSAPTYTFKYYVNTGLSQSFEYLIQDLPTIEICKQVEEKTIKQYQPEPYIDKAIYLYGECTDKHVTPNPKYLHDNSN